MSMPEQDAFEPMDDPYDDTSSEEDLPDETDAERNICLKCGNILVIMSDPKFCHLSLYYCPVCA